jgi:RNA polymerase sigma-70 factor, ECF subfamily
MNQEDNKLIENFLSGEVIAFEILLKKYLTPTYNFIFRFTKERTLAEDLAQETFLKAWKNLKRYDKSRNFKTWLFTIAKNTTYDYFKKKKTTPFAFFENEEGYNKLEKIADEESNLAEIIGKKELEKELGKKLEKLPDEYRLLLLLRYKDGFTLSEIGEILGRPYNTIKSQHQRALISLKKEILN